MAKRPENKPLLPKKVLSAEGIKRGIERIDERIAELKAFNVQTVPKGTSHELTALSAAIRDTLDRCFDEGTSTFQRFERATQLNFMAMVYTSSYPARQDYIEGAQNNITAAIALLQEAQRTLREDLADAAVALPPQIADELSAPPPNKVFIVHGHDDAAKLAVARFIEKLGLEAIILHEQPNQGRTIIEKFQDYAAQ